MTDSVTHILQSLSSAEDADSAYILAAAINLYSEALRRKKGRILYGPADVRALLSLCTTLLTIPEADPYAPARPAKPSAVEAQVILEGMEATLEPELPLFQSRH